MPGFGRSVEVGVVGILTGFWMHVLCDEPGVGTLRCHDEVRLHEFGCGGT